MSFDAQAALRVWRHPGVVPYTALMEAARVLADAHAALFSADDGDPVTADWVAGAVPDWQWTGPARDFGRRVWGDCQVTAHMYEPGVWAVAVRAPAGEANCRCRTRGEVRALFRALRVPGVGVPPSPGGGSGP